MADRECTDRVKQWAQLRGRAPSSPEEVAEYAATVRREALEEAAVLVEKNHGWHSWPDIVKAIRTLKVRP